MKVLLKPVNPDDIKKIFSWRNQPSVRNNMFDTKEIPWEEHLNFWNKRLAVENLSFIIQADGQEVGLVRVDERPGGHEVDIFLDSSAQGRGIGRVALAELFEIVKKRGIKRLIAQIKCGNDASRSMFEKSGFKERSAVYEWEII